MLIINAKFEVQAQAVEQYEALIKDLVASSRQE
ncbi:MAG TPA: antibiotic biosynthesis monooxygenase, partial [Staphylococcus sp.]|nr:antibiotic biosynthesis monooxygenase [Staphylococcus sp.]